MKLNLPENWRIMRLIVVVTSVSILLLTACGSPGISESFSKEIKDFEMAWNNTVQSFKTVTDSIQSDSQLQVNPDSTLSISKDVKSGITDSVMHYLDSIKSTAKTVYGSFGKLAEEIEEQKLSFDKKTNEFNVWKDKVLNGEIDIETAKKDLVSYKEELKVHMEKNTELSDKYYQVRGDMNKQLSVYKSGVEKLNAEAAVSSE